MTKTAKKHIILILLFLCVICAAVWLLGKLTEPKYMSEIPEGAMTSEYYAEKLPHDVIFIGDCEVYENFSPVSMWREAGITSYIRGSAQQLIWQSCALLEEVFQRESPQVVVYNVQAMKYSEPQSEAYNRMTIDGMPLSEIKLRAIHDSMTGDESVLSYLIPLVRWHSRWSELTAEDFQYIFTRDRVTVAGYLMQTGVRPMTQLPSAPILSDPAIGERCWEYLDRIRALCEEHGARLILIKSPSLYPHWYDEWDEQIRAYADGHGLDYINFLPLADEIGIDMQTDTYDGGLHLNVYGAEKLGAYFSKLLSERYGVPDRSGDESFAADWAEKCTVYDEMRSK